MNASTTSTFHRGVTKRPFTRSLVLLLILLAVVLAALIFPQGVHSQEADFTVWGGIGWPFNGAGTPAQAGIHAGPGFSVDWHIFKSLAIGFYNVGATSSASCWGCPGPVDEESWNTQQLMLRYDFHRAHEGGLFGIVLGFGQISYSWIANDVPGEWEGSAWTFGISLGKYVPGEFAARLQLLFIQPLSDVVSLFPLLGIEVGWAW